jgi:hypothetical protein
VITDCYPPPDVWRHVDEAAHNAEKLAAEGREIDFHVDDSGRLEITLLEAGTPQRALSALEALAIAAGAPV